MVTAASYQKTPALEVKHSELLVRFCGRELIARVAVLGSFTTAFLGMGWCWFFSWKAHRRDQSLLAF